MVGLQRREMFLGVVQPDDDLMPAMEREFVPRVRVKLAEDKYICWLDSEERLVVCGAGL